MPDVEQVVRERRRHRRHGEKEGELRGRGRSSPITIPPTIVAPDRETPGISASVWHSANAERARQRHPLCVGDDGRRTEPFDDQHHDAAGDERHGDHARSSVEHALDEAGQQGAGDERGHRRDDDHKAKCRVVGIATTVRRRRARIFARYSHMIAQNRAELDHHGEHAARIVVAEQPAADQQVRRGRNRQKLGDPLDDAKQRSS